MKYSTSTHTPQNQLKISLAREVPFFQSDAFFRLAETSENFSPALFLVYEDNDIVASLLAVRITEAKGIKGLLSSRVVVYGGPVLYRQKDHERITSILLDELAAFYRKRVVFIQFRNFRDMSYLEPTFKEKDYCIQDRLNLLVDTHDREITWGNMSSNRRRQVKKSLDNGARIVDAESLEEVRVFYNILEDLYRNRVHKPLPHWSLFKNFFEQIHGSDWGRILLIKFKDDIIGGILCPITPQTTIFEWYVCGLDLEYKDKKIYPSVLATWAAMDFALKNNIPQFDFMGVGIPEREYGVRDFKNRFGGEMVNYGRYGKINNRFIYTISELGYNILAYFGKI